MILKDTKMVSFKSYVVGWLDSSILDLIEFLPNKAESLKFALITCLDSNPAPASLIDKSPQLKSLMSVAVPLDKGLLLPTKRLLEAISLHQIFFGFDEIWFFPKEPKEPKPDATSLVGPARIDQQMLTKLGPWLSSNSCSMGLGDGEGLNLIIKAGGLVRYLLGHSISQTAPSLEEDSRVEIEDEEGIVMGAHHS